MNREEFKKIVMALNSVYTGDNFIPTQTAFDMWYESLKDLSYNQVAYAAKMYIQTNHFPPRPSDLRTIIADCKTTQMDYGEGWNEVQTAIRRYGYMREQEALDSMSDITREVVKRLGFQNLCMSPEGDQTNRANFRMIFQQLQEREKQHAVLSPDLQLETAAMQMEYLENRKAGLIEEKGA